MIGSTMRFDRWRPHRSRPAVLIVDDNDAAADAAADAIAAAGYRTIRARDGLQALEALRREQPAVLLVDLHLPGMSGSEFLRIVRNDATWAGIPRVVMTATNDPMIGVREDAPVVYKPVDLESLVAVVRLYCDRSRSRTAAFDEPRSRSGPAGSYG
jgi:DNA-binding response OmpR family regulator